jgi:hypothetical protein
MRWIFLGVMMRGRMPIRGRDIAVTLAIGTMSVPWPHADVQKGRNDGHRQQADRRKTRGPHRQEPYTRAPLGVNGLSRVENFSGPVKPQAF